MNDDTNLPDGVERSMSDLGAPAPTAPADEGPSYRVMTKDKIAVPKQLGKVWKGRRDSAMKAMKSFYDAWSEAIKYYNNDQLEHRVSRSGASGNTYYSRKTNERWSETENVVFSNVNSLLPAIYMKNPEPSCTPNNKDDPASQAMASVTEQLLKVLSWEEASPGVNLKIKIKQAVVCALLTNAAWIEVGWNEKDPTTEEHINELNKLASDLLAATTVTDIKRIEGQIRALESVVDLCEEEGPFVRVRSPFSVLVDVDGDDPIHSDSRWMMVCDMMSTDYVNARFGKQDANDPNRVVSVFEPTHVLTGGQKDQESADTFTLFDKGDVAEAKSYGYEDEWQLKNANRTKVWWIWDKTTRRLYLFHDKNWDWPMWVYNDPYQLPRFFPFRKLSFHTNAVGPWAKGEVTYYLDQQDAINEINDEERRARQHAKRRVIYDKAVISRDDMDAILKGDDGTARGIDLTEGKTMKDVFLNPIEPFLSMPTLFDTSKKLAAIDRISAVSDTLRGVQFKTNTTNQAINTYQATTQLRIDDKVDSIEDFVGGIYSDLAFLCYRFMDKTTVVELVGNNESSAAWMEDLDPKAAQTLVRSIRVVGGSTMKPTGPAKKHEAIEVGQILGQFQSGAPGAVTKIMLKLFQSAFHEIDMTEQDWEDLSKEIAQQQMVGNNAPPPGGAGPVAPGGGPGSSGGPPPNQQGNVPPVVGGQPPGPGGDPLEEAASFIDSLPPPMKKALGESIARGVPVKEAVQLLQQMIQHTQQPTQGAPK